MKCEYIIPKAKCFITDVFEIVARVRYELPAVLQVYKNGSHPKRVSVSQPRCLLKNAIRGPHLT